MTPMRAHNRLVVKNENLLLLTSNLSRRFIFLVLLVVFTAGLIIGFDPATDLAGSRLFGTIGYVAVLMVLLGVTAWSRTFRFDRENSRIEAVSSFFGVAIKRDISLALDSSLVVVLQKVQLFGGQDRPFKRSNALSNLFEPRSQLFRLFLEAGDERIKLDESSYTGELEREASMIADFLGVVRKTEEL